jgi:hypothetical protein
MKKSTATILLIFFGILLLTGLFFLGIYLNSVLGFQPKTGDIFTTSFWLGGPGYSSYAYHDPINCDFTKYYCQPVKGSNFEFYGKKVQIFGSCGGTGAYNYYFRVNDQYNSPALNPSSSVQGNGMSPVSVGEARKKVYLYDNFACREGDNCPQQTRLVVEPCITWYSGSGDHVENYYVEFYPDKLSINFTDVNPVYVQGENLTINFDVVNNFGTVNLNLCAKVSVNSLFASSKDYCIGGDAPIGKNSFKINLPVTDVNANSFTITPYATAYSVSGNIKNMNIRLYDDNGNFNGVAGDGAGKVKLGSFSAPSQNFSINVKPLQLGKNQLVAMESFSAGKTISKYSTRYPVVAFSPVLPVIIADATTNSIKTDKSIYEQLDAGKAIQVPSNQVYSLFYVIDNNYQLPTICDVLDVKTNECAKVNPGVVQVCSEGQFDSSLGLCVVQPSVTSICTQGRYDVQNKSCIYNPPIQAVCLNNSVYNVNLDKCTYTPSSQAVCNIGNYNVVRNICEYTPSSENVCSSGYVYNSSTQLCERYPSSSVICLEGFTYNKDTITCERKPESKVTCPSGYAYEEATDSCINYPDLEKVCSEGSYDDTLKKCVVEVNYLTYNEKNKNLFYYILFGGIGIILLLIIAVVILAIVKRK